MAITVHFTSELNNFFKKLQHLLHIYGETGSGEVSQQTGCHFLSGKLKQLVLYIWCLPRKKMEKTFFPVSLLYKLLTGKKY